MKTVAWLMALTNGEHEIWAVHEDAVLYVHMEHDAGIVHQQDFDGNLDEAEDFAVLMTDKADQDRGAWMAVEPVLFDLTPQAIAEIYPGRAIHPCTSPTLRAELEAAMIREIA